MHRHAMDEDQHKQVMEDLTNDFLCDRSSFVWTSPADPPLRRRRQRPPLLASRFKEVERINSGPLERNVIFRHHSIRRDSSSSTPGSTSSGPSRAASGKRMMDPTSKEASPQSSKESLRAPKSSTGPNPDTSPKHESLRPPSTRKFLWKHTSLPDAPARRHRHVRTECASRAHSDGRVQDTSEEASSTIRRAHSEPLPEPAKQLLHEDQRPVELQRTTSPGRRIGLPPLPPSLSLSLSLFLGRRHF